jgi:hypothetical protein
MAGSAPSVASDDFSDGFDLDERSDCRLSYRINITDG